MTTKLFIQAIAKYLAGVVLLGLLLFLPAGTLRYPNGWLLMGLLFIPMLGAGIVMMLRDPALLEKRLNAKEREGEQKEVIRQSGVMFIIAFVLAGLGIAFTHPNAIFSSAVVLIPYCAHTIRIGVRVIWRFRGGSTGLRYSGGYFRYPRSDGSDLSG